MMLHRCLTILLTLSLVITAGWSADPTEAAKSLEAGLEAMRESDAPDAAEGTIVKAAVALLEAKKAYEELGDNEMIREVNSYLFWCKKKMTNSELDMYLAALGGDQVKVAKAKEAMAKVEEVAKQEVKKDDAEKYLASAKKFAGKHAKDPFRVHVRYQEVADRFMEVNTPIAAEAQKLSTAAFKLWAAEVQKKAEETAKLAEKAAALDLESIFAKKVTASGDYPVPDKRALRTADREMEELYGDRLKSKNKHGLAQYLFAEAKKSKDQPTLCYLLTTEAIDLASDRYVKDLWLVLKATEFLGKTFKDVDIDDIKKDAFKGLGKVGSAAQTLATDPDDAEANTLAGMSVAFRGNQLKGALPMLMKSDDEKLQRAAKMEATKPSDGDQMVQLGELWYSISRDRSYRELEIDIAERSLHWYYQGEKGLKGVAQRRAQERIAELEKKVPIDPAKVNWKKLTDKQWERLPGDVVAVDSRRTNKSKYVLKKGQRVRVVAHPTDEWTVGSYSGGEKSNWTGSGYYYSSGAARYGSLVVYLDKVVDPLKPGIIEGPGRLIFEQYMGDAASWYSTYKSNSRGEIRVKILEVKDDF